MKHLFLLVSVVCAFALQAQTQGVGSKMADQVQWNETTHKFGNVTMGPDAVFTFKLKNKGKKPVLITSAEPGCSCTVSDFTRTPIGKNKSGFVTATYSTKNRPGGFIKSINVVFEDGSMQVIKISGDVIVP
ncbi:MAG: DUF1573 domain-containing protein [Bacteroidetes bacterium]|nr:DUF1573 domain-containing protein [Bacteroidota bacterium]